LALVVPTSIPGAILHGALILANDSNGVEGKASGGLDAFGRERFAVGSATEPASSTLMNVLMVINCCFYAIVLIAIFMTLQ
jgi:hypothetical protein